MTSDHLPEEIISEILVRLPVISLIRSAAVCKSWRSLITSLRFASAHVSFSERKSENPRKFLLLRRFYKQLKLEVYSLIGLEGNSPANAISIRDLNFPFTCRDGYCRIVGSLHGLICLSDDLFRAPSAAITLWNPSVRSHLMLPKPLCKPDEPHYVVLGFGKASDDYKVVRLVYSKRSHAFGLNFVLGVEIYSLDLGKWTVLSGASVRLRVPDFIWSQVFLNGFVHWLAYEYVEDGSMRSSIMAFDLSKEVFSELTLPSELVNEGLRTLSISVISSSLAVIKYDRDSEGYYESCDVWMLKDYRFKESWTKLYKINFNISVDIAKVIAFFESGEALVVRRNKSALLYDPASKQFKNIGIHGVMCSIYVENYMESMLLFGRRSEAVEDELKA